jgi:hypothetical protein
MKWFQFTFILFFLLGLPLLQCDQLFDSQWLVCENSLTAESEYSDPGADKCLWFDAKSMSSFSTQVGLIFQLQNLLSIFYSHLQGTSPFQRPPPRFNPFIVS